MIFWLVTQQIEIKVCSELRFSETFYDIETSQIICFASGWLFNNTPRIYTESYFQTDLIKFFGQVFQAKYELFWNGGKSKSEKI